jgi:hypothetical protein
MGFLFDPSLSQHEKNVLNQQFAAGRWRGRWTDADREAFRAEQAGNTPERKAFEATQAKMRTQTGRAPTWLTGERDMMLSGRARLNAKSLLGE